MESKLFPYKQLESFTQAVFKQIGCTDEHASIATETLLSADLRGIDSHGIAWLIGYVRLWEVKRIITTMVNFQTRVYIVCWLEISKKLFNSLTIYFIIKQ